jgi:hypothetical protein
MKLPQLNVLLNILAMYQTFSGIEVLGIIMVDLIDSILNEKIAGLHEKIKAVTSPPKLLPS